MITWANSADPDHMLQNAASDQGLSISSYDNTLNWVSHVGFPATCYKSKELKTKQTVRTE